LRPARTARTDLSRHVGKRAPPGLPGLLRALLLARGSRASDPDDMAVLRLLTAAPAPSGDPEADRRGRVLQLRKPIADAALRAALLAARDRLRAAP